MQTLKGKTAIITGSGKGLGRAMALTLAKEGVNLGLISRTEEDLKKVVESAKLINSDISIVYCVANISHLSDVKNAASLFTEKFDHIDILVNNAGIFKSGSILEQKVEDFEEIIQVNLLGTFYVVKEFLPHIIKQGQGDIINLASTAGLKGSANMSAYGASKAALINFTESLMQEVRKSNIRVSTINPSTIATELTLGAGLTDGNPDKVLQPQDLAELVAHQLKLPQRSFVKEFSLWSTNP